METLGRIGSQKGKARENRVKSGSDKRTVRFNLYLTKEVYDSLERLRVLSGKRSIAETIRSALRLYNVVQEGIDEGKDVMLIDRNTKERDRLVPM
jgi:hypothetical protein